MMARTMPGKMVSGRSKDPFTRQPSKDKVMGGCRDMTYTFENCSPPHALSLTGIRRHLAQVIRLERVVLYPSPAFHLLYPVCLAMASHSPLTYTGKMERDSRSGDNATLRAVTRASNHHTESVTCTKEERGAPPGRCREEGHNRAGESSLDDVSDVS